MIEKLRGAGLVESGGRGRWEMGDFPLGKQNWNCVEIPLQSSRRQTDFVTNSFPSGQLPRIPLQVDSGGIRTQKKKEKKKKRKKMKNRLFILNNGHATSSFKKQREGAGGGGAGGVSYNYEK